MGKVNLLHAHEEHDVPYIMIRIGRRYHTMLRSYALCHLGGGGEITKTCQKVVYVLLTVVYMVLQFARELGIGDMNLLHAHVEQKVPYIMI